MNGQSSIGLQIITRSVLANSGPRLFTYANFSLTSSQLQSKEGKEKTIPNLQHDEMTMRLHKALLTSDKYSASYLMVF